jgi:hypothetical protein
MAIEIDITSPEGNTLAALAIAGRVLKQLGRAGDIVPLRNRVFAAESAKQAREAITVATNGLVTFIDPREEE